MKKNLLLLFLLSTITGKAQVLDDTVESRLRSFIQAYRSSKVNFGTAKLDSVSINHERRELNIYANSRFAYQPFREENVEAIYRHIKQILPGPVNFYETTLYADLTPIEQLIPNLYRSKKKDHTKNLSSLKITREAPWVYPLSRPYSPSKGLSNAHLSLWQSHGLYYNGNKGRWDWQRPRLFCTTEDQFTQSFIIPFLIPMLENAGAIVYTPRERDTQKHEIIVDNDYSDSSSFMIENNSRRSKWKTSTLPGFAKPGGPLLGETNPFQLGSARYVATERKAEQAFTQWIPTFPEEGFYAVYVAYQTLPNSVSDAKYTVFHKGGATEFQVNQKIGGGTWVYLGTFEFDKGNNSYGMVALSNESNQRGVVSADAVRFGGGMGNVSRNGTSGVPRYLEGSKYLAQWAGLPPTVYNGRKGTNDYIDDINTRSNAINYLSGGSLFNPGMEGLKVPLELNVALHSDAGYDKDNQIIGTLGIYTTNYKEGKLGSSISRLSSRDLSDIILTQLEKDIQSSFNIQWTRRSLWNRNYSETRLPEIPSTIIELLSHQNFSDLVLGHDPNFKFTVARSIYKSILKFRAELYQSDYIVQPLPVEDFKIEFGKKKNSIELSWKGKIDIQEPTATPNQYLVYTRIGHGGFDNGTVVNGNHYQFILEPGITYSFKVAALNQGGESFPSEILTAYKAKKEKGRVLIINGFDRLSGPATVRSEDNLGFDIPRDPGVPYLYDLALCGEQLSFDKAGAGKEGPGSLGYSDNSYEGLKIAGNSFDYPFIHGKAIQASRVYSFVSSSKGAVEKGEIDLSQFQVIDLILGLQKREKFNPSSNASYPTFSPELQIALSAYTQIGGNLLVSGSYLASDMLGSPKDKRFIETILKYSLNEQIKDKRVERIHGLNQVLYLPRQLNEESYAVTTPESLLPVGDSFPFLTYETQQTAAVAYPGKEYRTVVLGFPFESIIGVKERGEIMASILNFLLK